MPVDVNFLDDGAGVELIISGATTGKENIEANSKLYTKETLSRLKYKIIDRTACTEYRITSEEIQLLAQQNIQASRINNKFIIVFVSPTPEQYGMTRMWQVYVEESYLRTEIFKDRQSANEFISKNIMY